MLAIPYLHEKEFQVLGGHDLIRRGNLTCNLATRQCDHLKDGRGGGGDVGCVLGYAGSEQGGSRPLPAGLQRRFSGFGFV